MARILRYSIEALAVLGGMIAISCWNAQRVNEVERKGYITQNYKSTNTINLNTNITTTNAVYIDNRRQESIQRTLQHQEAIQRLNEENKARANINLYSNRLHFKP